MLKKGSRKRIDNLIDISEINEELKLIDITDDYYITKSGDVYHYYGDDKYYKMKLTKNARNGYLYVRMVDISGLGKTYRVHKLVAKAWLPNPYNFPIVGHKDNDKTNNNVDNLYWTTNQENIQKAVDDGLLVNDKGYDDSQSKPVIAYDVNMNVIGRYGSCRECHRELGVSVSTITRHCEGLILTRPRAGYYFKYQNA